MKQKLKKILIVIILAVFAINIINIICESNYIYAEEDDSEVGTIVDEATPTGAGDGILGILLYGYRLMPMIIGVVVQAITGAITKIGGGEAVWSVDGILFNSEKAITSIDFFNFSSGNTVLDSIRNNVATWYMAMRNIAVVVLLGILLYVGIRMALSTVGEQEAKYKKMLIDWTTSLALVFVLHYIMIFTIEINKSLVDAIAVVREESEYETALEEIAHKALDTLSFTQGVGAAIIYTTLTGVTLIFLFMYIKRMLTVGFLIIIAPLITITYSIDKMGDGKSQALNAWLKEFVFNILIQPFHCVIYVVFTNTAIKMVSGKSIGNSVFAILMIVFMFTAEKIIKKIFNFQASSMSDAIANTAFIGTAMKELKSKGSKNAPDPSKIQKTDNKGKLSKVQGEGKPSKQSNSAEKANAATSTQTKPQKTTAGGNGQTASTPVKQKQKKNIAEKAKDKFADTVAAVRSQGVGNTLLKGAVGGLESGMRHGAILGMSALGLATGDWKGAMSGYAAGKGLTGGLGNMMNGYRSNKLVKANQESFAGAYSNYQQKFSDKSDRDLLRDTAKYLNMSEDEAFAKLDDDQYEYWSDVQKMRKTFINAGEDSGESNQSVLETVRGIQSGEIEATFDGIQEWVEPEPVAPSKQNTTPEKKPKGNGSKKKSSGGSKKKKSKKKGK